MITISQRKLLIWATLSLFFVFAFSGRTFAITKAKLFAPDGVADDNFGLSVAIDGNVLVVGAPYRDDANGSNVGSAYVFEWNSTALQWDPVDQLFADNGAAGDNFGSSVAIDGIGRVFATGGFEETVDFGGGELASAEFSDIFLLQLLQ